MSSQTETQSTMGKGLGRNARAIPSANISQLSSNNEIAPVVSDSFMGGSAPHLQYLCLERVPIPGLPKILSSATDLVHLILYRIPHSECILPEAIVTCISTLARLKRLHLGFESLQAATPDVRPHPHALFFSPSLSCTSPGSTNIWRTSWPRLIVLYSTVWT